MDGHHYGFIVTFATAQARDASLNDPNHRPVAQAIGAAAAADCRLRHLSQPGSHLLGTRTDQTPGPAHGSRSPSGSTCKPTVQRALMRGSQRPEGEPYAGAVRSGNPWF